jgi:hypothetical protein
MSLRQSLPRPIKQFVKPKLSERGFYSIRDAKGLGEHGFYDCLIAANYVVVRKPIHCLKSGRAAQDLDAITSARGGAAGVRGKDSPLTTT